MARPARRVIAITGVSRGLGQELTKGFARMGHRVIGCARSPEAIAQLASTLGRKVDLTVVDVTHDAAVRSWAERVLGRHGPPHLLVNNAALINRNAVLWEVPVAEFDQVVDVNIKGVANVIRHFLPAMVARGSGVIVNFSSEWGRSVSPEVAPYCATKWAVEGLTRALARELPTGLAAVPVSPGVINTDMLRSCFGESALNYQSPARWAKTAIPFLLGLGPRDNGKPLSVRFEDAAPGSPSYSSGV